MTLECAKEPASDGVSAEQVVPAEAGECGVGVPGGGEGRDRLRIGVDDVRWGGGQHCHARSAR